MLIQYIHQTLTLALPSIAINGLDTSPSILTPDASTKEVDPLVIDPNDPSYEPYDARLAQKVRDLYANVEEATTRVAELRREAPATAAKLYVETLKKEIEEADRVLEARKSKSSKDLHGGLGQTDFQGEDIQESWIKGREGLEGLRNVTKVKADLERALKAVAEVEMG